MTNKRKRYQLHRRTLINVAAVGLLLYIVLPAAGGFDKTAQRVFQADAPLMAAAALCIAASMVFAAVTYCLLALRPVAFLPTLYVQIAGGFVNRLLPAGLGGLGLNAIYLIKHRHTPAAATAVVATNNLLGFTGNVLLLACALPLLAPALASLKLPTITTYSPVLLAAFVVGVALVLFRGLLAPAASFIRHTLSSAAQYAQRRRRLALALVSSLALTALHVAAFYLVVRALGLPVTPVQSLLAISAGAFAGALLPTPGGLGGAEAGLAAVLVSTGVEPAAGLAAALAYRTLTFWLPLLPGFLMLHIVEKRYL